MLVGVQVSGRGCPQTFERAEPSLAQKKQALRIAVSADGGLTAAPMTHIVAHCCVCALVTPHRRALPCPPFTACRRSRRCASRSLTMT